jgi:hypothetical protein
MMVTAVRATRIPGSTRWSTNPCRTGERPTDIRVSVLPPSRAAQCRRGQGRGVQQAWQAWQAWQALDRGDTKRPQAKKPPEGSSCSHSRAGSDCTESALSFLSTAFSAVNRIHFT